MFISPPDNDNSSPNYFWGIFFDIVSLSRRSEAIMNKPKYNLWQNSGFVISQAWHSQKSILLLVPFMAALAVANNVLGLLVTPSIIEAVENHVPLEQLITTILFFVAALMLVGGLRAFMDTYSLLSQVMVRVKLVITLNDKLCTTAYINTEDQKARKIYDRAFMATNSDNTPTQAIWLTLINLLTNIGGFVIYMILLSALELWIIAVVLITSVIGFFFTRHINGWGFRHRDEEADYSRRMHYITTKAKDHHLAKDLRIFGMSSWLEDMYSGVMALFHAFIARREKVYIWGNIIDIVLSFLRNGVAYIYLIYMVVEGDLPASLFLLYFVAVGGLTEWVSGILNNFSELHTQSLDITSVREFLEYDEPFKFETGTPIQPIKDKRYDLALRDVTFRHPGAEHDVIKGLNLTIPAGEKLAIVGLNGVGKTTLIKLLCGFYDPAAGEVLLNGENIKQYDRRDYYRHFSAVFQDFSVLSTTIAENVTQLYGEEDIDKIKHCIALAGLTEKIESLPQQYHNHVGREIFEDGVELSGGETQRLILARALYKTPPSSYWMSPLLP